MDTPSKIAKDMGQLRMGDLLKVEPLMDESLSPRDFANKFIHLKLRLPTDDVAGIADWSDEFVLEVLQIWVRHQLNDVVWSPPDDTNPFLYFKQLLKQEVDESRAEISKASQVAIRHVLEPFASLREALTPSLMQSAFQTAQLFQKTFDSSQLDLTSMAKVAADALAENSALIDTLRAQNALSSIAISTPLDKLTKEANQAILTMLGDTVRPNFEALTRVLEPAKWPDEMLATSLLQDKLAGMADLSLAAQDILSSIQTPQLGAAILSDMRMTAPLADRLAEVSQAYLAHIDSFIPHPQDLLTFPNIVSDMPPRAYLADAHVIGAISVQPEEAAYDELSSDLTAFLDTEGELDRLLTQYAPDLVPLLQGARQALASTNPDRVRHFITSLREIFTQLLHRLAPDKAIERWESEVKAYHNGRPTRETRLRYICRGIAHKPFGKFVEKDVEAMLELADLFERGTHQVSQPFTEIQIIAIKVKVEGMFQFLLEISSYSD